MMVHPCFILFEEGALMTLNPMLQITSKLQEQLLCKITIS
uniref:Uncharacterized protein n=1 Tax=Rhizophora mucronata TaxID=61149 RepID=A0A2P2PEC3_RHIMU